MALSAVVGVDAYAQEFPSGGGMMVDIDSSATQVLLGAPPSLAPEAYPINITLQNTTAADVILTNRLIADTLYLHLLVLDPHGRPVSVVRPGTGGPDAPPVPVLLIGEEYVPVDQVRIVPAHSGTTVPVTDLRGFYPMTEPGTYTIQAKVSLRTYPAIFRTLADGTQFAQVNPTTFQGVIVSNILSVHVVTDQDGDGYAYPVADPRISANTAADCHDQNAAINPGAVDVPGNGIDDDCNPNTPDDGAAPVTVAAVAPPPNANGWNKTDVTVTLTATDSPGVGVRELAYQLTGAVVAGPAAVPTAQQVFPISNEGITNFAFRATDNAGNVESEKTAVARVDKTAPQVQVPAPINVTAPTTGGVAVGFTVTATDNLDATPTIQCTPASGSIFPIGTTTVNCTATDKADNQGQGNFTVTVTLSAQVPVVTSVTPNTFPQGTTARPMTVTGSNFVAPATVTISGSGATTAGTAVQSSTQLTTNITVSATAATGTRNVTVTTPDGSGTGNNLLTIVSATGYADLIEDQINAFVASGDITGNGTANSLLASLSNARAQIGVNNNAAKNILNALINKIDAFENNGKITAAAAAVLRAQVTTLISAL